MYLFSPEPVAIHSCTSEEIRSDFAALPKIKKLDVILNSGGGVLDDAFKIGRMLRRHAEQLTFFVPSYAKSGATLIALGGDQIVMLEEAELGPLDTQLPDPSEPHERISALNGFKALEAVSLFCHVYFDETVGVVLSKSAYGVRDALNVAAQIVPGVAKPLFDQVDPHRLGLLSSALDLAQRYATELASGYGPKAAEIAGTLVRSFPTHDYVIDIEQAQACGLKARAATEKEAEILRELAELLNVMPVMGFADDFASLPEEAEQSNEYSAEKTGENGAPAQDHG